MTTQQREYTVETLVSHFHNQVRCATVVELYDKLIDDMKRGGKLGNAGVYKYSRTSLLKFTGQRLQIPFSDIDAVWLRRYENWLRTSGCGDTTISQLFRTLRSVFNKAVELQLVKRDYYPFDAYKVSKFDTRTKKRAITKEDVRKVIALDLSQGYPSERLARDIFVFSYFGAGINFADIALLKYGNIRDGRVQYVRKKTGNRKNPVRRRRDPRRRPARGAGIYRARGFAARFKDSECARTRVYKRRDASLNEELWLYI